VGVCDIKVLGVEVEEGSKAAPSAAPSGSPTADALKETETKKPNSAGQRNVAWGGLVGGLVAVIVLSAF